MSRILLLGTVLASGLAAQGRAVSPIPTEGQTRAITIGSAYTIHSDALQSDRHVNVTVPESCNPKGASCPVLVVLDGGLNEDFLPIAGLAKALGDYGSGPQVIVVGVEGVDRRHDLTSPSSKKSDLASAPTSGGAARYRRFLVGELKPWIARHFAGAGLVTIMGESLAGLFALETAIEQPRSFDNYIAVSPSLWWNDGKILEEAKMRLRAADLAGRRIWIGFERPAPPAAEAAKDSARQRSLAITVRRALKTGEGATVTFPEGHETVYLPAAIMGLRYVFASSRPR